MGFTIGQKASLTKSFTEDDVRSFASISLDKNPIHLDEESAKKTVFGKRVVHGILVSGLISAVLGNKLPGPGSIYREQLLTFKKPVFLNDEVTATVEIMDVNEKLGVLSLKTTVKNAEGQLVISGKAKGIVPKETL